MKIFYTAAALLLGALLLNSCGYFQKPATGQEDDIIVVADSSEFQQLEHALDSAFEKIIYTPQPEKLFNLRQVSVDNFDIFQDRKNIIIVAPFNSNSNTAQYIRSAVDSTVKKKILADSVFEISRHNIWAKGQLVMLLTAPTMDELKSKIIADKDNLLYAFQKISDKRLSENLYDPKFEQKDIEGELLKEYNWVIYCEANYQLAVDDPHHNFVWLRSGMNTGQERWIFVHWIDNASPAYLNSDSVRAIRNRMTEKYYRTTDDKYYVQIASDYYTTNEVNFNGQYAILTQGLWQMTSKGMGGPFVNYTFYDEKTNRIYMLDGSIFAPGYYKRNIIQQMDVTLKSFMQGDQLSKDRIKELLNAAKNFNTKNNSD
jgi:Domain of unknown function (DUF4837)